MLDKTIPFTEVIMINDHPYEYPHYDLPEGYTFVPYTEGMGKDWAQVQLAAGHIDQMERALTVFEREFAAYPEEARAQMVLVAAPDGRIVGTNAIWRGDLFGRDQKRIHWVSVDDEHAGKGIAKAMMTRAMEINERLKEDLPVYLDTQTWSYRAIGIYKAFGFVPYLGEKPVNAHEYDVEKLKAAWELIDGKLAEYRNRNRS